MPEEEIEDFVDDPVMSIGTLSKKLGLSVSALRKYETGGLLIPHRTDSGHRDPPTAGLAALLEFPPLHQEDPERV
ncbi:MAG: MerR family transcriptional regulator [Planctomycetota bacterium]|jgi:hypothetical protein